MDAETYAVEARVSESHWWFAGRRRLLGSLIRALGPTESWRVLEVGAGTGANLPVLCSLGAGRVIACDVSAEAMRLGRTQTTFTRADAANLPFRSNSIDLLLAADVVEHLDDDCAALREFIRVLRPGGHLVLTAPAFPALWGQQDIVGQHRRRYRRGPLLALVREAGFLVSKCFYFNYLLFLPIWLARKILQAFKVALASEGVISTPLLDRVLTCVFFLDVDTAPVLKPPFGVSVCVVAAKPKSRPS